MISGAQPRVHEPEARWRSLAEDRLAAKQATDPWSAEVAAGVAAWCTESVRGEWVRDEQIDAWLAYALCALGRADTARRVAPPGRKPAPSAVSSPHIRLLARDGILSAGPGDPIRDATLKLDLYRLAGSSPCLELRVYRLVQAAFERLARAWRDRNVHAPCLAVTGLRRLARAMEGTHARADRVRSRAADLRCFIQFLLSRDDLPNARIYPLDLDP